MEKKAASGIMLTLLLSTLILAFNVTIAQSQTAIGIGIYRDENCTQYVSSINWGSLTPGSNKKITVFVRNEWNETVALSLDSSNWNPQEAADFITLVWNYARDVVEPSNVVPVTLDLQVSAVIVDVNHFSFDIIISATQTQSLTCALTISAYGTILYVRAIGATVDFHPQVLNLGSKGQWITVYIQLPQGYNAADINATTILLNGTVPPVLDTKYGFVTDPSEYLVDHNNDGILERMVKFDRAAVESFIHNAGIVEGNVTLTITGKLFDGTDLTGADSIFVFHTSHTAKPMRPP